MQILVIIMISVFKTNIFTELVKKTICEKSFLDVLIRVLGLLLNVLLCLLNNLFPDNRSILFSFTLQSGLCLNDLSFL